MSTVTFNFFANYLNTSPAARGGRVRRLQQQATEDYHPAKNFWHWMVLAIANDRRTTRDGAAVTACAKNNTDSKRAPHFDAVATAWSQLHHRWDDASPVLESRRPLPIGGLTIDIKPTFVERFPDGRVEVVLVWLAVDQLGRDIQRAVLRLLELAYPDTIAVFVDVRRRAVLTSAGKRLARLDPWIRSEAAGLAHLLDSAA